MSEFSNVVEAALGRDTDDTQPAPEAATSLDAADVHEMLSNDRRRFVIEKVGVRSRGVDELAAALAAGETGKDPGDVSDQERKRAYVALYQTHLPRLNDLGVIDWTPAEGRIHQGPEFEGVRAVLQAASVHIADEDAGEDDGGQP